MNGQNLFFMSQYFYVLKQFKPIDKILAQSNMNLVGY